MLRLPAIARQTTPLAVALALPCLLLVAPSPARAQRLRIVIDQPDFRPFPLALPDTVVLAGPEAEGNQLAKELTGALRQGIDIVRALELVPTKSYLEPERENWAEPKYKNWLAVGASGVARCAVEKKEAAVKVRCRLFDVVGQRELLFKSYDVTEATMATAAHQFLDAVVESLTGEPSIFSSKIAFVKRTTKGKSVLISAIDGRDARSLTDPSQLSLLPSWDRSGRYVLFTSYLKGNPDLFRIDLATDKLEWLSKKRGLNTGAAVSPDGKRIAMTLSLDGNTEIYVMDWSGENLTRLTNNWAQDVSPSWSPDGKRIAFVSSRSGQPHIYVMNADGSSPKRLTFKGSYNQEPSWSPRAGGKIAFTARDEFLKYDIFTVDPDTSEITRLTQDEGNNESPSFAPDGMHIVFTSSRPPGHGSNIYIMDMQGRNQRRITRDGGYETPRWGPRIGW